MKILRSIWLENGKFSNVVVSKFPSFLGMFILTSVYICIYGNIYV